eukprot:CAMPEP_0179086076 /NCGR_PEP_ID=MMETSP0796-20121207/39021_1 /TAXON_ID=73915 /ORGANISM="Pyrodinium bahamense, Strain pbaha01" /LENGTH=345 /DNA_ID=CAMNT_0020783531 /DNA_START=22 /DNA_END=1059 /DNA_ORIENTATION=+
MEEAAATSPPEGAAASAIVGSTPAAAEAAAVPAAAPPAAATMDTAWPHEGAAAAALCQNFDMSKGDGSDEEPTLGTANAGDSFEMTLSGAHSWPRRASEGGLGGLTAPSSTQAGTASGVPEGLAAEVRERLRFLNAEDQKTVCRRECQLAQKREEALCRLAQQTIEQYSLALEVGRAVTELNAAAAGAGGDGGEAAAAAAGSSAGDRAAASALPPELIERYEARMRLLHSVVAVLAAEPAVSLPQLSALEQAKGFAFTSYAQTARVVSRLKENTAEVLKASAQDGASGGAQGAPQQLLGSARAAFGSLASRLRSRAGSGPGGDPAQENNRALFQGGGTTDGTSSF